MSDSQCESKNPIGHTIEYWLGEDIYSGNRVRARRKAPDALAVVS